MNADALARVPVDAPNREQLTRLLETVESAQAAIAADTRLACWHSHMTRCAAALLRLEQVHGTPAASAAKAALYRAVDAGRNYARAHGFKPDTRKTVEAEARLIVDALR